MMNRRAFLLGSIAAPFVGFQAIPETWGDIIAATPVDTGLVRASYGMIQSNELILPNVIVREALAILDNRVAVEGNVTAYFNDPKLYEEWIANE